MVEEYFFGTYKTTYLATEFSAQSWSAAYNTYIRIECSQRILWNVVWSNKCNYFVAREFIDRIEWWKIVHAQILNGAIPKVNAIKPMRKHILSNCFVSDNNYTERGRVDNQFAT